MTTAFPRDHAVGAALVSRPVRSPTIRPVDLEMTRSDHSGDGATRTFRLGRSTTAIARPRRRTQNPVSGDDHGAPRPRTSPEDRSARMLERAATSSGASVEQGAAPSRRRRGRSPTTTSTCPRTGWPASCMGARLGPGTGSRSFSSGRSTHSSPRSRSRSSTRSGCLCHLPCRIESRRGARPSAPVSSSPGLTRRRGSMRPMSTRCISTGSPLGRRRGRSSSSRRLAVLALRVARLHRRPRRRRGGGLRVPAIGHQAVTNLVQVVGDLVDIGVNDRVLHDPRVAAPTSRCSRRGWRGPVRHGRHSSGRRGPAGTGTRPVPAGPGRDGAPRGARAADRHRRRPPSPKASPGQRCGTT